MRVPFPAPVRRAIWKCECELARVADLARLNFLLGELTRAVAKTGESIA